MSEAFDKLKNGDRRASTKIVENTKNYIILLIKHIDKENNILFPCNVCGNEVTVTK